MGGPQLEELVELSLGILVRLGPIKGVKDRSELGLTIFYFVIYKSN